LFNRTINDFDARAQSSFVLDANKSNFSEEH